MLGTINKEKCSYCLKINLCESPQENREGAVTVRPNYKVGYRLPHGLSIAEPEKG